MHTWRKSSYSGTETDCVEVGFTWRKSSYTATEECVEVFLAESVGVRDTKARNLGQLTVSRPAWTALCSKVLVMQPSREHRR
ncbi:DUF397 domain-containing protein [Amycolatopsis sp. NPDC051758]|uniref:DUF397 domain-containing protein n=1 Tax=Amycolatopsis sp. NPDC051758 TaxID=3363935 RepID=UPI003795235D